MTLNTFQCEPVIPYEARNENTNAFNVLNQWDLSRVQDYVQRTNASGFDATKAVTEYRRFIFMALSAKHPCVPSCAVDEVWHAHLLFSRDYSAFCKAMGRDYIHHEPAMPGEKADLKLYFEQTTAFYEKCFGEKPAWTLWGNSGQAICDVLPGSDCRGTCHHNCRNE